MTVIIYDKLMAKEVYEYPFNTTERAGKFIKAVASTLNPDEYGIGIRFA